VTEEKPPFGGSWGFLYALVLLNLAAIIALAAWFTKAFE
jgi:hypothetical protein